MRTSLQQDEKVLLVTRPSWVTLIVPALVALAGIVTAVFTLQFSNWFLLLPLAALGYFGWKYYERQHNLWAVTNFRVIDEFGIIDINTRESPLDKINNVSYSQDIWGRILGYGNVEIQTAATIGETVYRFVEKPGQLKDTITSAQANYKNAQFASHMRQYTQQAPAPSAVYSAPPPQSTTAASPQLATELEKLFDLKQRGILSEEEYQRAKGKLLGP